MKVRFATVVCSGEMGSTTKVTLCRMTLLGLDAIPFKVSFLGPKENVTTCWNI